MRLHLHRPHMDPHKTFRNTKDLAHTLYFAFAFLEGHSMYATTAGGLFLLAVIGFFMHEEV